MARFLVDFSNGLLSDYEEFTEKKKSIVKNIAIFVNPFLIHLLTAFNRDSNTPNNIQNDLNGS